MGASHEGAAVAGNQLDTTLLSIRCDQLSQIESASKKMEIIMNHIYIYHVQQVNPCKSTTEMSLFLAIHVCLPQDTQNHVEPRGLTEQIDGCGENTRKSIAFP